MALKLERTCPSCGEERSFYRSASMLLHLGLKTKWACLECGYGYVRIDGEVDTSTV